MAKKKRVKKGAFIVFLLIIAFVISVTLFFVLKPEKKEKPKTPNTENKQPEEKAEETKYVDDNPIKLKLYVYSGASFSPCTEHTNVWQRSVDIGVFIAIPTNKNFEWDGNLSKSWLKYWNSYPGASKYKIGYNLKFTMSDGTKVSENILNPTDADAMFKRVMVYLYDETLIKSWNPHIEEKDVTKNTHYTTIKLTGNYVTSSFKTPITLTAFTYKSYDDFDPVTGEYRGNSSYKVTIRQSK